MSNDLTSRIVTPEKLVQNQGAKVLVYGMAGAGKTSAFSIRDLSDDLIADRIEYRGVRTSRDIKP